MNATMSRPLLGALVSFTLAGAACSSAMDSPDPGGGVGGTGSGAAVGSSSNGTASNTSSGSGSGSGTSSGTGVGGSPGCASEGAPFDLAALEATVQYLASDELAGRAPGTPGDEAARAFMEERFICLGLVAAGPNGSYQQPFVTSTGKTTTNIVGYVQGSDPAVASEIILVGAHHDHLGMMNGEIYNGANDNASGVAAMMAIAHAVKQQATAPRRTIAFVAFGYEEHDGNCEGSEFYVDNTPNGLPLDRVVYMVNTDMVGVYPLEESLTAYGSFAGTPGRALLDDLLGLHPGLNVELNVAADEDASDFQAFYDLGIPYVYFETWDEPCWHEPCDKANRIDYPSLAEIATLSFELVLGLADSATDLATASQKMSYKSAVPKSRKGRRHGQHDHRHGNAQHHR